MGLKSRPQFKSCIARQSALKEGKRTPTVIPTPTPNLNPSSIALFLHLRVRTMQRYFSVEIYRLWNNMFSQHERLS